MYFIAESHVDQNVTAILAINKNESFIVKCVVFLAKNAEVSVNLVSYILNLTLTGTGPTGPKLQHSQTPATVVSSSGKNI